MEVVALTNALDIAVQSEIPTNIYTDSAYAFHSTHTWGPVWKSRNFTTAAGAPIAHKAKMIKLFDTLTHLTPLKCSVIKVTGHSFQTRDALAKGNDLADKAAKAAADHKGGQGNAMGNTQQVAALSLGNTQEIAAFSCTELIE